MIHAGSQNVRLLLNGDSQYIWTIPAGESVGISGMAIYSMTVVNACSFRYEGLGS